MMIVRSSRAIGKQKKLEEMVKESLLAPDRFEPLRKEPEPVVLKLSLSKEDVEKALKNFREETTKALDEAIDKIN